MSKTRESCCVTQSPSILRASGPCRPISTEEFNFPDDPALADTPWGRKPDGIGPIVRDSLSILVEKSYGLIEQRRRGQIRGHRPLDDVKAAFVHVDPRAGTCAVRICPRRRDRKSTRLNSS